MFGMRDINREIGRDARMRSLQMQIEHVITRVRVGTGARNE